MPEWLEILRDFGLPVVCLAILVYAIRQIVIWVGVRIDRWMEPLIQNQIKFTNDVAQSVVINSQAQQASVGQQSLLLDQGSQILAQGSQILNQDSKVILLLEQVVSQNERLLGLIERRPDV